MQTGAAGGSGWSLTGNAGTVAGTNFLGTTDDIPFEIRVNNTRAGYISSLMSGNRNTTFGYFGLPATNTGSDNTSFGIILFPLTRAASEILLRVQMHS